MGVPAFFRWLCKKYPSIVVQCNEEKPKTDPTTDEKIPVDTSQPNPNGVEFDNLYLDMNGIIHPCTHPEDRPAPKNEDEMMLIIFEFIDRIFAIVRPRKLLYMAIDGVAPRAKMNQQRSRRFRAAKEAYEKTLEIRRLKDQIISNGGTVPPDVPHSDKFDSNCITPGTPFMHKLAECLRYYVHDRLNNDPGWANLTVILSDANVPGEGEHKIMDYIRRQRANPDHDPNTHHVLCGADADLIMLGLATHEPYFTIIREEFRPDRPRPCEICSQFGHDTKECTGLARVKSGEHDEMANSFVPSEQRYIFLRLSVLREYLNKELFMENLPFQFDIERAIDDWVFLCFFVGNDFLPHLPSLEIREGAIDRLVKLYKSMISNAGGYLTESGDVNLARVQTIMSGIGQVEDDIFKRRQNNEINFRQRQKEKKKRSRMGEDLPSEMPAWMKTGPYAPTPLGRPKANPISTSNKFEQLDASDTKTTDAQSPTDDSGRGLKRKSPEGGLTEEKPKRKSQENNQQEIIDESDLSIKEEVKAVKEETEEEEDPDANDPVRLWEDGWRERYYKIKFDVDENDIDFRIKLGHQYTIGLQWVLKYYYQGVPAWNWYYPYYYAPFASDFVNIVEAVPDFDSNSEPFKPFEQLMAVFPAASKKHIPEPWQSLMTDKESAIIDFYPEDFQIDLNGKKQAWQGVALLPFVDEQRLKDALKPVYNKLSFEEIKRNVRGNDCIFVGKPHKLYVEFSGLYQSKIHISFTTSTDMNTKSSGGMAGKIWCYDSVILENEVVKSPLNYLVPDLTHNKVLGVCYHDPIYNEEYVFKTNILEGANIPENTLKPEDFEQMQGYRPNTGFNRNYDYRNNRNPATANRMIQNTLGGAGDMISSAHGGHHVYGTYKSNNNYQGNNNYNNNSNNYNGNNRYNNNNNNNYNNNYNNNRNFNNNNNNNYQQRNNFNNNNNNNNYNNNRNNNYNNNNNYNRQNSYQNNNNNKPNQHQRFNNDNNDDSQQQQQRNNNYNYNNNNNTNNNQRRQFNR